MSNKVTRLNMWLYEKDGTIETIKRLREKGWTIVRIARELNMTESRVRNVMKNINIM